MTCSRIAVDLWNHLIPFLVPEGYKWPCWSAADARGYLPRIHRKFLMKNWDLIKVLEECQCLINNKYILLMWLFPVNTQVYIRKSSLWEPCSCFTCVIKILVNSSYRRMTRACLGSVLVCFETEGGFRATNALVFSISLAKSDRNVLTA